jgi:DnaJ-class molecular chaperone
MKCKRCKGTGEVLNDEDESIDCPECNGTGEVEEEEDGS